MRKTGDPWNTASALCVLSGVMGAEGNLARAETLAAESLAIRRAIHDAHGAGESLAALSRAIRHRDGARALSSLVESLGIRRAIGDRAGIAECESALDVLRAAAIVS
jgi:hypothetical protein